MFFHPTQETTSINSSTEFELYHLFLILLKHVTLSLSVTKVFIHDKRIKLFLQCLFDFERGNRWEIQKQAGN